MLDLSSISTIKLNARIDELEKQKQELKKVVSLQEELEGWKEIISSYAVLKIRHGSPHETEQAKGQFAFLTLYPHLALYFKPERVMVEMSKYSTEKEKERQAKALDARLPELYKRNLEKRLAEFMKDGPSSSDDSKRTPSKKSMRSRECRGEEISASGMAGIQA